MLPVPASVSRAEPASLVLLRPGQSGPPLSARGHGRGTGRSERSLFVIDGPSLEPTLGSPVVVIAVKVVGGAGEDACLPSQGGGSALSRVLRLPVIGDPYAQFGEPDRGTLVDEYA
jgi:hypothetical protein